MSNVRRLQRTSLFAMIVYKLIKFIVTAVTATGDATWHEWSGALGRWQRGEPLQLSKLQALQRERWTAERIARRVQIRAAYEKDPMKILDHTFKREFEDLGIYGDVRAEVLARCGRKCAACGRDIRRHRTLHIDHIKPRKHHPHLEFLGINLQVMCSKCNVHKSAYDGDDWKEVVAARRRATRRKATRAAKYTRQE